MPNERPRKISRWLEECGIRKAQELGDIVGRTIWVFWPCDGVFYRGKVTSYNDTKGLHHVEYEDGSGALLSRNARHVVLLKMLLMGPSSSSAALHDMFSIALLLSRPARTHGAFIMDWNNITALAIPVAIAFANCPFIPCSLS